MVVLNDALQVELDRGEVELGADNVFDNVLQNLS